MEGGAGRNFGPGSPDTSCSSFLLGGNYYPGKDKKKAPVVCGRYRTTWWHRLCCSSTPRLICSIFLLIVGTLTVFPSAPTNPSPGSSSSTKRTLHVKLEGRKTVMEDDDAGGILGLDGKPMEWKGLKPLTPMAELRENAQELNKKLEKLMWGNDMTGVHRPHNERWKALEKIAPKWVRRNDVEDEEEEEEEEASAVNVERAGKNQGDTAKVGRRQLRTLDSEQVVGLSKCPSQPSELSTTLVIQSTVDRTWLMEETCRRWKDPIVLVIYISKDDHHKDWESLEESCPQLTVVQHIATSEEESKSSNYPVNVLRNEGLDAVQTSHILVMDVDFVPSADLHKIIRKTLGAGNVEDNHALVVPAFERRTHGKECKTPADCQKFLKKDADFIPRNIAFLRACVQNNKDCIVFQSDNNWEGHFTTHSDKWLKGDWYDDDEGNEHDAEDDSAVDYTRPIKSIKCFDSLRYEPYVVIRWCPSSSSTSSTPVAPYYDERFHGYGKNKIQQISHLRFRKYQFFILPRGFIVHHPHPTSKAKESWNDTKNDPLHRKMDSLYPKYLKELERKYGDDSIVPPCKALLDRMKRRAKNNGKNRPKQKTK